MGGGDSEGALYFFLDERHRDIIIVGWCSCCGAGSGGSVVFNNVSRVILT